MQCTLAHPRDTLAAASKLWMTGMPCLQDVWGLSLDQPAVPGRTSELAWTDVTHRTLLASTDCKPRACPASHCSLDCTCTAGLGPRAAELPPSLEPISHRCLTRSLTRPCPLLHAGAVPRHGAAATLSAQAAVLHSVDRCTQRTGGMPAHLTLLQGSPPPGACWGRPPRAPTGR